MNDIHGMNVAMWLLALAAWTEFLGLRQPIRDGIARLRAWLVAKALALKSWWTPKVESEPVALDGWMVTYWPDENGTAGPVFAPARKPRPKPEDIAKKAKRRKSR